MIFAIRLATGCALLVYAAVSLWPFEWELPVRLQNHAQLVTGADAGIRFPASGIALTTESPEWVEVATTLGSFEFDLRVRSSVPHQTPAARIVTLSRSAYASNFAVAQYGSDLFIWLRTYDSIMDYWDPVHWEPIARVNGVFLEPHWVDVRVLVEPGLLTVFLNKETAILEPLPQDALASWDPTYALAFGNEMTYDRPWLGEIQRATVRVDDTSYDYVRGQTLEVPPDYLFIRNPPSFSPLEDINIGDGLRNLVMYVPLGFMFCLWLQWGDARRSSVLPVLLVIVTSISLESLQLFISTRHPSLLDVLINSTGGCIGIWIAKASGLSSTGHPAIRKLTQFFERRVSFWKKS